jgi:hypothetical protein
MTQSNPSSKRTNIQTGTLLLAASLFASLLPATAQSPNPDLQQKVATLKQSAAENQQKLHQYQWIETTQLALNGDAKPSTQSSCLYGPDGKVQKTPLNPPQQQEPSGGRLKQRVIAKKKGEMKDYMGQVKTLLALYLPPDPQHLQQAAQSGKVSLNKTVGSDTADIVFKDYALPGDQMVISFNTAAKKIASINVNTYLDDPKDTVTLAVTFASLPDSTNYVQQTVLNATAKKLQVTTTSSNYQPLAH